MTRVRFGHKAAPWAWAALSLMGVASGFLLAFVVAAAVLSPIIFAAGVGPLRYDLALFLLLFGLFGSTGVLAAGRLAFGRWIPFSRTDLVVPIVGTGLAIAIELALHAWAEATIGMYDPDFIGVTAGLSILVIALAVARFGASIAPSGAGLVPTIAVWLGGLLVLLIVASNLPGAADGIGPHGWPAPLLVGGSGMFALVAMGTTLHAWRPR